MARVKVRPWRHRAELLSVRAKLYLQNDVTNVEARRNACAKVAIWRRRARLPHAIESTALLVQAQIQHLVREQVELDETYAVRAAMATALARFVTGFCDINQPTVAKRSMFDVAADLNIPEQWVELRHQFTHGGELPAISPLEEAVEGALIWLWTAFWSRFGDESEQAPMLDRKRKSASANSGDEEGPRGNTVRQPLRKYLISRKEEIKKGTTGSKAAEDALCELTNVDAQDTAAATESLLSHLVGDKKLLPSNRALGSSMLSLFHVWEPLLMGASTAMKKFPSSFVFALLEKITIDPSIVDDSQNPVSEAFMCWIHRVLTSRAWDRTRARDHDGFPELQRTVLEHCALHPGVWTQKLSARLCEAGDPQIFDEFDLVREAGMLLPLATGAEDERLEAAREDDAQLGAVQTQVLTFAAEEYSGWKRWPGKWRPMPIGVVEGEDDDGLVV